MGRSDYDVFISYARSVSTPLAIDLQHELERFAKKWNQVRAVRVFRDDSSMSANTGLWSTIESALTTARYLILIATPESAASEYVGNEVRWWLEHKGAESILLVLAGGRLTWDRVGGGFTPDSVVPPVLQHAFPEEPRWIDMTWYGQPGSAGASDPRFQDRVADLAAPVRGVDRDALIGANLAEHRKTMRRARIAIAALATLLVGALVAGGVAITQRNTAKRFFADAIGQRLAPEAAQILKNELAGGIGRGLQETLVSQQLKSAPDPGAYLNAWVVVSRVDKVVDAATSGYVLVSSKLGRIATHSAARPGDIQIWDTDLKPIGKPIQAGDNSYPRAFSHDGSLLAVTNETGLLELWDLRTRTPKGSIQIGAADDPDPTWITNVSFTSDDRGLVIRSTDSTVRFYGADTLQPTAADIRDTAWVTAPEDGNILAIAPIGGDVVEIRDPWSGSLIGEPLRSVGTGLNSSTCRSFDQAGNRLLIENKIFDITSRRVVGRDLTTSDCSKANADLSPDGTMVATGGDAVKVDLSPYDPGLIKATATLLGSGGPFPGVAWADDHHVFAISSNEMLKIAVDRVAAAEYSPSKVEFSKQDGDVVVESGGSVIGYRGGSALNPVPGRLATAEEDYFITVETQGRWNEWFFADGKRKRSWSLLADGDTHLSGITYDTEKRRIVVLSRRGDVQTFRGGTLRRWDLATGQTIGNALPVPENLAIYALLDFDGSRVTAFTKDRTGTGATWSFDFEDGTARSQHEFVEPVTDVRTCRAKDGRVRTMVADERGGVGFANGLPDANFEWSHPPRTIQSGLPFGSVWLSDDCRTGASWSETLQFWDVDSGVPLGDPILGGKIVGTRDDGWVAIVAKGVSGFGMMPVPPTAEDLCSKLEANMSRSQWDEWISPNIEYKKACPELPIAPDE
jgi:WD40 repeat protein